MSFEKMRLTVDQAGEFLTEHTEKSATELEVLSGGEWSQAFGYCHEDKDYVVRFNPSRDDFLCDVYADRFDSAELPIPAVVQHGAAFKGYYAITERAFGTMIDDLDAFAIKRLIPSLFRTLDAIRRADVSDSTGYGMWDNIGNGIDTSWEDVLLGVSDDTPDSRISGWKEELKLSPIGDMPFRNAYGALKDLAYGLPADRSLIHSDLLNYNALTNNDQITAVFDWGNAKYGDFLHDFAEFAFWGPIREPLKGTDWGAEAKQYYEEIGLAVPELERRLQCCMLHVGLDAQAYYSFKHDRDLLLAVSERTTEIYSSVE